MTSEEVELAIDWLEAYSNQCAAPEPHRSIAALIRRLRDERDSARVKINDLYSERDAVLAQRGEARNKALDEAAEFTGGYHSYQDIKKAILALKSPTKEPTT